MATLVSDTIGNTAPLRGTALTTQDSHRTTWVFTPYVYRGTGKDTLTGRKKGKES